MRYLIDAYNLFFKLEEEILPLQEKREAFIALLDAEGEGMKHQLSLVFDSHQKSAEDFASKKILKNVDVIFSPKNLSADQYLLELIEWEAKNTILVTSDKSLAKKASHLGAQVQSVEAFVAQIIRQRKKGQSKGKIDQKENPKQLERYLEIFTKRLDENDEQ